MRSAEELKKERIQQEQILNVLHDPKLPPDEKIKELTALLKNLTTLEITAVFSKEDIELLAKSFDQNSSLKCLRLTNNSKYYEAQKQHPYDPKTYELLFGLSKEEAKEKADIMQKNINENFHLKGLSLKKDPAIANALAEILKKNSGLEELYFDSCDIDLKILSQGLQEMQSLKVLSFENDFIDSEGMHALAENLKNNHCLQKFIYPDNDFDIETMKFFLEILGNNRDLEELHLQGGNFQDPYNINFLCKILGYHQNLRYINLNYIDYTNEAAMSICNLFENYPLLAEIDYWDEEVIDDHDEDFSDVLNLISERQSKNKARLEEMERLLTFFENLDAIKDEETNIEEDNDLKEKEFNNAVAFVKGWTSRFPPAPIKKLISHIVDVYAFNNQTEKALEFSRKYIDLKDPFLAEKFLSLVITNNDKAKFLTLWSDNQIGIALDCLSKKDKQKWYSNLVAFLEDKPSPENIEKTYFTSAGDISQMMLHQQMSDIVHTLYEYKARITNGNKFMAPLSTEQEDMITYYHKLKSALNSQDPEKLQECITDEKFSHLFYEKGYKPEKVVVINNVIEKVRQEQRKRKHLDTTIVENFPGENFYPFLQHIRTDSSGLFSLPPDDRKQNRDDSALEEDVSERSDSEVDESDISESEVNVAEEKEEQEKNQENPFKKQKF